MRAARPKGPRLLAAALVALTLVASVSSCRQSTTVERIRQQGVLKVVTRNAPTTYYQDRNGPTGFEYTLSKLFAEELGVDLEIFTLANPGEILDSLSRRRANLAAAGLIVTVAHTSQVTFGPPYMEITQQLVYRTGNFRPQTLDDLAGRSLLVRERSSHAERLRDLQRQMPDLAWKETADLEVVDLLRMVENGELDFTVVNSNEWAVNQAFFPRVRVAFNMAPAEQLAWALRKERDDSLLEAVRGFFARLAESGRLTQLRDQFYGHVDQLNYVGARTFIFHMKKRLPRYEPWIRAAAERYDLDWRLLAAIGYQESHWDPDAVSPTGVRGFMMLTQATARELGVKNRLDPRESIFGGADYLQRIRTRLPDAIREPDRTWFALAAYNVGLGHLQDAQDITRRQGGNPYSWSDVAQRLPLLQQEKWYRQTRYGYARGWEPVHYVANIRRYYDVLVWNTRQRDESLPVIPPQDEPGDDIYDSVPSVL